jgi:uroporphyrinogen-III decarboxylase
MTDQQWELLLKTLRGELSQPMPTAFIVDSPWLSDWYGVKMLDYLTSDTIWLEANLKAHREFPDTMFLPGFWAEYGMCTEPSAFGVRCTFLPDEFPHAHRVIRTSDEIDALPIPDPRTDGFLPLALHRVKMAQKKIETAGHRIRFATARGPLNIASFLMGTTEFLTAMMMEPEKAETLMQKVTAYLKSWIQVQRDAFPSIDGIFLLDDIIGFLGEREFRTFGLPYFKDLFDTDVSVRFLHNDAPCRVSAPFLAEMGVNLFNMEFNISLNEVRRLAGPSVTLLGNIPPRDVLAAGTAAQVADATADLLSSLEDRSRIIISCGGGTPPGASSENLAALIGTVRRFQ